MAQLTDQAFLLQRQYADATNLEARVALHERYSLNRYGWQRWVFDQLDLPDGCCVLELGCGPAGLWVENQARVPDCWQVLLSDFSAGMLRQAARALGAAHRFDLLRLDAQAIPLAVACVDAVIANHMLYRVPDLERALAECRRILRPGGRLVAATNGSSHLRELAEMTRDLQPDLPLTGAPSAFTLENGIDLLRCWFDHVSLLRYEDELEVTEAEPLVAYVRSLFGRRPPREDRFARLRLQVEQRLRREGSIRITKATGILIGRC